MDCIGLLCNRILTKWFKRLLIIVLSVMFCSKNKSFYCKSLCIRNHSFYGTIYQSLVHYVWGSFQFAWNCMQIKYGRRCQICKSINRKSFIGGKYKCKNCKPCTALSPSPQTKFVSPQFPNSIHLYSFL